MHILSENSIHKDMPLSNYKFSSLFDATKSVKLKLKHNTKFHRILCIYKNYVYIYCDKPFVFCDKIIIVGEADKY